MTDPREFIGTNTRMRQSLIFQSMIRICQTVAWFVNPLNLLPSI